ncbi:MAG: SpoVR family protein [Bdellovibrionales bacterium]|nr:SpoVR family protein [Bdellovibrionales bacterium]
MHRSKPIDGELLKLKDEIQQYAVECGLEFDEVIFEVCDYQSINILAAQGGFPNRYPHWRFGMDYDQLSKGYTYGLQKIYEMVINSKPCYAYLFNANHFVDQKIVMAHVYGHADFFRNNYWFKGTNKNMMDVMANHGTKIRRYMDRYGQDKIENFIDKVLSLENLLDPNVLFESPEQDRRRREQIVQEKRELASDQDDERSKALKSYMNSKIDKSEAPATTDLDLEEKIDHQALNPSDLPTRDIMKFMLGYAPLEDWQADIIGILREEAYYFLPQRMTKIMNEGWASYWHSTIMTQRAVRASEIVDFADHHAGVMAMSRKQINPYKIGIELFRDIEYRWDTGRFGKEYQDCEDMTVKANWDKDTGLGKKKIFEIRKTHNDITFIDEFFTQEFCERQQLFTYNFNPRSGRYEIDGREFQAIKAKLLAQLTNFGVPVIEVESSNHANRGEILLRHIHQGVDLALTYAADTMKNIFALWKRPVNLVTTVEGKELFYQHDGIEFKPVA